MNPDPMSDGFQPFPSLSAPKQKSWSEIRKAVRKSHRVASQMINHMPQHFSFRKVGSARRLYFLSIPVGNRENTLLYVDLPNESISTYEVLEWHDALEPFYQAKFAQLSKEEQLLRERKRQRYVGIASYDYLEFGRKSYFAFAASTCLFVCSDDFSSSHHLMPVTEVVSKCSGKSQIDPKLCPVNPDLLAFVSGGDLWVSHTVSGCEERLTFVHKGLSELASDPKTAGVPSFVVQEEFDRYTGYWWQTSPCPTTDGANTTYRILYEEVDESQVDILKIISPASEGASIDEYRYPKAGSRNAISTLRIVEFNVDANNMICGVVHRHLPRPLFALFPTMEYLLKAGWIPDEPRIYFELIDRLQQVTQLVVMDVDCFLPTRFNDTTATSEVMDVSDEHDVGAFDAFNGESTLYWIIYEERSDKWINVSELLYFLPQTTPGTLRFIRGSEKSGFMHLYVIVVSLIPPIDQRNHDVTSQRPTCNRANVVEEVQLTRGEWAVDPKEIWVDEKLEFVYFMGYKDTPLETHLYIVQIDSPGLVSRLTKEGFSHSVTMDEDCSMFVTVHSSISMPNACEVYSMNWGRGGPQEIPCCLGTILESHKGVELQSPELFSFHSSCGHDLHGMLYQPTTLESSDAKHPVLLFVYCGPQVQLVSNSYKAIRFVRLHTLADMGFVVVVIDGRGSCHRGKEFESHIRLRLYEREGWPCRSLEFNELTAQGDKGTVEIEDQIEGLQWLSQQHNFMDMDRVAVHGWSYGGYITLMALVQHPEIFKVAIAGAPVTSWNLYDTGYTERYMDLPANNPTGYANGSLLKHVDKFPNEEGRLLIVQGLMDENVHFYHTSSLVDALVKACKPHTLQVYPNERHGIRSSEANEHYETMLISFLQRNL